MYRDYCERMQLKSFKILNLLLKLSKGKKTEYRKKEYLSFNNNHTSVRTGSPKRRQPNLSSCNFSVYFEVFNKLTKMSIIERN